jgi:hypothetical protein
MSYLILLATGTMALLYLFIILRCYRHCEW